MRWRVWVGLVWGGGGGGEQECWWGCGCGRGFCLMGSLLLIESLWGGLFDIAGREERTTQCEQ